MRKYPEGAVAYVEVPDVTAEGAFDYVFKLNRIRYVIHLAAPSVEDVRRYTTSAGHGVSRMNRDRSWFQDDDMPDNSNDLAFGPAMSAAENMVAAISEHGENVRVLVLGSCFGALVDDPPRFNDATKTYSARDTCMIDHKKAERDDFSFFIGCKASAENAAWDAYAMLCASDISMCSIAVPICLGPPIHCSNPIKLRGALHSVWATLQGELPGEFMFPFYVDVRDAARAFVRAIQQVPPQTTRWFVAAGKLGLQHWLDVAHTELPQISGILPKGHQPGVGHELLTSQCNKDTREGDRDLELTYRPFEETLIDTYNALVAMTE
jgi:nucleoside-diphosphate-sugar epimerase